jgi:TfoX-like protein
MTFTEQLATRVRDVFRGRRGVVERKVFGGVAFMYENRMCCGVVGNNLVVRVAEDGFATAKACSADGFHGQAR